MTLSGIIDCHMDSLVSGYRRYPREFHKKTEIGHIDTPRLIEGGIAAVFFAVYPAVNEYYIKEGVDMWFKAVEDPRNKFYHIKSYSDLKRAEQENKIGAILHFEGAGGIDSEFINLRNYYRLGLRSMGITWSNYNKFGTGVGIKLDRGLTAEGKALISEMENLGIIVDVSHLNEKSFWDVVDVATKPFIASHSNAYSICDHKRNLKDEQIRAIKDADGVIGLNLCVSFLKSGISFPKSGALLYSDKITFEQIKKHIDHIIDLAGIDHIALGSDYDGATVPEVLKDVSYYPNLITYLEETGFTKKELEKIKHENIERVMKSVWK
ncbi:MAG: dipeptidase [Candidatus Heimdallarchaeaceae archaeon]